MFRKLILALALVAPLCATAQTVTTINQLPAAVVPLSGGEVIPIFQGTGTKKVAVSELRVIYKATTAPSSPYFGQWWWDTSAAPADVLRVYDGAQWAALATLNTSAHTFILDTAALPASVVTLPRTQTLTNKTITGAAVSGGTVDNAVIGGTTRAAVNGTTGNFNGALTTNVTGTANNCLQANSSGVVSGIGAACAAPIEGSWTPSLTGSTSGTATPSVAVGRYINIGTTWIAYFNLQTSNTAAVVGSVRLSGLPWTQNSASNDNAQCTLSNWNGFTLSGGYTFMGGIVSAGNNFANLTSSGSAQTFSTVGSVANTSVLEGVCIGRS